MGARIELVAELTGHLDRVWQAHWSPVTVTLGSLFQQQQQHPSSHPSSQQPPLSNLTIASCSGDRTVRIHSLSLSPEDSDEYSHLKNTLRKKYKKAALRCSHSSCVSVLDMDAHKRTIRSVQFAPSGRMLATASFDGTTAVWEKQTTTTTTTPHNQDDEMDDDKLGGLFDCVATLEGHENEVKSLSWCSSGTLLATCGRDKSVWIWEIVGDSDFECLSVLQEHTQDVKMVLFNPQREMLASASYDDTIKLWVGDEDDWYCADTLKGHGSTVWAVDFDSTGNRLVSVSDDRSLKLWREEESTMKWVCQDTIALHHSRSIYSVSWSKIHRNLIVSVGGDGKIKIISVGGGESRGVDDDGQIHVVAEMEEAHGHADINCVQWCPQMTFEKSTTTTSSNSSSSTSLNYETTSMDHDKMKQQEQEKLWNDYLGYLFLTAGDDGLVKVWRLVM